MLPNEGGPHVNELCKKLSFEEEDERMTTSNFGCQPTLKAPTPPLLPVYDFFKQKTQT